MAWLVENTAGGLAISLDSEAETRRLGRQLARVARPGTVVGLIGPLGAGKTFLVRAIVEAMGVPTEAIGSPTFVLIHEYEGRMPIYHFDAYRLDGPAEFDELGAEEYFEGEGLCLVEWADRVAERLPRSAWLIRIVPEGSSRKIFLEMPEPILRTLAEALAAPALH